MRSEMCMCQQRDGLPGPNLNSEAKMKACVRECRFARMTKSCLRWMSGLCDEEGSVLGCSGTESELFTK